MRSYFEDFILCHEQIGRIHATFCNEKVLIGSTRDRFSFEGTSYYSLTFRAKLQANGRWRISYLRIYAPTASSRYAYYPLVEAKDPRRRRLTKAVRDLIVQWWEANETRLERLILVARERTLIAAIGEGEVRRRQDQRMLRDIRAQLTALPEYKPEGKATEDAVSSLLDLDTDRAP